MAAHNQLWKYKTVWYKIVSCKNIVERKKERKNYKQCEWLSGQLEGRMDGQVAVIIASNLINIVKS